jgi:phosphoribosylformylglycinamidine synthase
VRVAVVFLPGCDARPLPSGCEAVDAGAAELPPGLDAVALLGSGPAASASAPEPAILAAVRAFVAAGGPVLGVGAGFQALCAAGLLPGTLEPVTPATAGASTPSATLRVEGRPTPFTREVAAGRLLHLDGARVEWRYAHPAPETLERAGQVVFRYVDEEGGVTPTADPTASARSIAGVTDEPGRVVGLAAHPAHPADLLGAVDGVQLLDSLAWR